MKDVLLRYYNIHVIGVIHLSERAFKIKSDDTFFVAKLINDNSLENMFENINTLQISYFVKVILNIHHQFITPYKNQYIYLMPYLENIDEMGIEMKIHYYLNYIANIHHQTSHYIKLNQTYMQEFYDYLFHIIQEGTSYYQQLVESFEKIQIRSPTQWFYMMNYYRIIKTYNHAKQYLLEYQEHIQSNKNIRVTLNYQNFYFDHILIKDRCLLSIDHICIHLPVFDLYHIFRNKNFELFDSHLLFEYYMNIMSLNDDEIVLLKCLLSILPMIELQNNQIDNIILLSQLLNYIDAIDYFIHQI